MATASAPPRKDLNPAAVMPAHRDLYYAGRWQVPHEGTYVDTINPAPGEPLARVAQAGAADVHAAIEAAHNAFVQWRKVKPLERAAMLKEVVAVLRAHAEELAMLDALNTGNPVAEMVSDAERYVDGEVRRPSISPFTYVPRLRPINHWK